MSQLLEVALVGFLGAALPGIVLYIDGVFRWKSLLWFRDDKGDKSQ